MRRLLFLMILFTSVTAGAQYQYDYGIKIGASNYLGDIGGKNLQRRDYFYDMHLKQSRYAFGIYGRYKFSKRLAVNANFDHILIQDADMYTTYIPRATRNLNFRNRMFEFGARVELTLWYDNDVGNRGFYNPDYKLYAFAGVAAYYSNPQGRLIYDPDDTLSTGEHVLVDNPGDLKAGDFVDNTWYNLKKYGTEGTTYSNFGFAIPVGIGMYFTFNKEWRVGWEISWRKTFSDYLDDVSTYYNKPDPASDDDYAMALALQSQTYQELLDAQNELLKAEGDNPLYEEIYPAMSINDFRFQPGQQNIDADNQSSRGLHDPANPLIKKDNYITTQITVGKVIRGRSKFYKSKYSWVKNRNVRRSRAKF
ncbi:MAG: outer membrane beta-barrel protein [Flavobacteriales bacterium]|nr:outer membrane beta-barrel protein [Flavobacteriales bacterium]